MADNKQDLFKLSIIDGINTSIIKLGGINLSGEFNDEINKLIEVREKIKTKLETGEAKFAAEIFQEL